MHLGRPLIIIAAIARNRGIGIDNRLPWRIPEDLAFFKSTTMGQVLLMGRKTYESIGRPLPGRTTVVMSRGGYSNHQVIIANDWHQAAKVEPNRTLFLAGGASLYAEALPWCSELILTHVDIEPTVDAFFPEWAHLFDAGEILAQFPNCVMRRHRRL